MRHLLYLLLPITACPSLVGAGPTFMTATGHVATKRLLAPAAITPKPLRGLRRRQDDSGSTTCGYITGDSHQAVIAPTDSRCVTDSTQYLWGFCPTTVTDIQSCSLAAACQDSFECSDGCGLPNEDSDNVFTVTWYATRALSSII